MPNYVFEALDESGQQKKDRVTASNSEEAIAQIRRMGLFPTSVREEKVKKGRGPGGGGGAGGAHAAKKDWKNLSITIGGVGQKQLTTFTRQLSTLQDAGLPILRSIEILEQQQKPGMLKNVLEEIYDDVSGGATLSDAMAKHPKAFDRLYTKMIAAGEVGGVLDLILQRLAEFMEKAAKLKKRIVGALIYPSVVLLVALAIVMGIMVLIVPKFKKIFEDFDTTLPDITLYLMMVSNWLTGTAYPNQMIPGIVIVIFSPVLIFFGFKLISKSRSGKNVLDRTVLFLPIVGQLVSKSTIAKFTRTLGTLITAGVPILDALNITRETTGNAVYANALSGVHDSVRQGESFAEPLRQAKVCDAMVVNMIDVGEETGDLDKMLLKIADVYDEEVDVMVASLVSLLEPIMVVVLGVLVGGIVIALFMPLIKLVNSLM